MDIKGIARSAVAIVVIVIIVIAGVGAWFLTRPAPTGKQPGEIWVAIVTDVGGRGDMSFNDMGFRGCDLALEQGIVDKVTEVISTTAADYLPNLRMLAASGDYDLIIPIGYLLTEATATVAKEYPQQNFACIDFSPSYTELPYTPGTLAVLFREEQSGALAGALAGLIAAAYEKPNVGIVLGMAIPPVIRYEIGFRYGLYWAIGPNGWYENEFGTAAPVIGTTATKVIYDYTNAFDDPALGKTTAEAQLAHDLAVCWGVAGATGLGVFTAVEEYHTAHDIPTGQPPFIMGVDADQDWMKPGLVIGSAMKRIDQAVVYICQLVREGTFKDVVQSTSGILSLGITEGASGISNLEMLADAIEFGIAHEELTGESVLPGTPESITAAVTSMREAQPTWVWEGVSELESLIINGTVVVPSVSDSTTADTYRALWP